MVCGLIPVQQPDIQRLSLIFYAETYKILSGISVAFATLSPIRRQITHMLLTRAPLYSPGLLPDFPFDLHVLGTPPAFILSQDQTLRLNLLTKTAQNVTVWFSKIRITTTLFTASHFRKQKSDHTYTSSAFHCQLLFSSSVHFSYKS